MEVKPKTSSYQRVGSRHQCRYYFKSYANRNKAEERSKTIEILNHVTHTRVVTRSTNRGVSMMGAKNSRFLI